jgi:hypothetical protein
MEEEPTIFLVLLQLFHGENGGEDIREIRIALKRHHWEERLMELELAWESSIFWKENGHKMPRGFKPVWAGKIQNIVHPKMAQPKILEGFLI